MNVRRRSGTPMRIAATVALVGLATSCSSPPAEDVVARIDEVTLTVADVEAYLAANVDDEWGEEALSGEESDLVRSRMFDAFLEERILLHEAEHRGVDVTDAEVDAYLASGLDAPDGVDLRDREPEGEDIDALAPTHPAAPASDEVRRATARRSLRIQKLIDRTVGRAVTVDDAEVDAWLRQLRGTSTPVAGRVVLRALMMPSSETAERVRDEIRRRRMTFDEAVALYEPTPGQATATDMQVGGLPPAVREAIRDLREGQVSAAVEVLGDPYLFLVVRRADRDPGDLEAERARGRRELLEHRYLQAGRRLLEQVRERVRLKVYPENLPFRYVPDESS